MGDFTFNLFPIRWQDIIDIVLNSYILFRLYILFRGTNVIRIIFAMGVLWGFQRIAVSLGLIVTSWAVQGIIAGAALIIIIAFRNEIRNVLQVKNLKTILWGFPRSVLLTPIDVINDGVYELARRHMGALIVIPGKDDLEDMFQNGLVWEGKISKEMLLSIFWHGSPVHDGAAIIKGNRVTQVGAILPLSKREDIPSYYGTRHRAAFGLAEKSDALVLIVSEERGEVVAAKERQIHHVRDNIALQRLLKEHMEIDTSSQEKKKRLLTEYFVAALVSLLSVSIVWSTFSRGEESFIPLKVPVEYVKRKPNMEIFDSSVDSITLYLSGSGALINSISPGQVKVKLDLEKAVEGKNEFTLSENDIILPPGIYLRKIDPAIVSVTLDTPVKKELPIQVDWKGKLDNDMILETIEIKPEKTVIVGASKILEEISTIYTEKISLDDIKKSGNMVAVLLLPSSVKFSDEAKEKVSILYKVRKRI